jgi:phosphoenolpyruvate synthase/pyruvate phosphate dikinase
MVELAELKAKGSPDPAKLRELETLLERVKQLSEFNPMLGHRGCRLGITYPEIYRMQIQAVLEAAAELIKEGVEIKFKLQADGRCKIRVCGKGKKKDELKKLGEEFSEK